MVRRDVAGIRVNTNDMVRDLLVPNEHNKKLGVVHCGRYSGDL